MRRFHSFSKQFPAWACLFLAIAANGWAQVPARGDSGWTVRTFDVKLAVRPDASLDVTELIDADFEVAKHGIYREIPIRYAVGMQQYALRFRLLGVDDGAGQNYGTAVSYEENRVRIRIGDAARTLGGPVRYRIRYRVERAILWEGTRAWGGQAGNRDHSVLRWNATGTEWGVPIARTAVTVILPRDLDDSQLIYDAWTGVFGAKSKDFTKRRVDARTLAFETGALRSGEGITVEVTMPGDAVTRPGWMSDAAAWLADNFPYAVFPATLGLCMAAWFYRGRDLPGRGAIVVNYEPPDKLSPAEVGTLIDERVDQRDVSAVIIDLAVRGYLKIEEVASNSWFSSGKDYRFSKVKPPDGLKPFEEKLHSKLFDGKDTVLMSDLATKFYPVIGEVKSDLYRGLAQAGYFDGNPKTVRGTVLGLGLLALAVALGLCAVVQSWMIGRVFGVPLAIAGFLSAIVAVVTSRVMPRKTHKGRTAWEQIAGLEEYIRRAEVDDIQAQDRRGVFERLLPYAIIFGLSNRWAKAFAGLYTQPPDWYQPVDPTNYTTWRLTNDIDRSISSMNQSLPAMPRSTGSSAGPTGAGYQWSSGGFSGGGSVGGGFGGGGRRVLVSLHLLSLRRAPGLQEYRDRIRARRGTWPDRSIRAARSHSGRSEETAASPPARRRLPDVRGKSPPAAPRRSWPASAVPRLGIRYSSLYWSSPWTMQP